MPSVERAELVAFLERLLLAVNTPTDVAQTVADALVEADLHGHHSHGARLVPNYVERIERGTIRPSMRPEVVDESAMAVTVDGRSGFGQHVGKHAIEEGVSKAEQQGIAVVNVRNATHLGCIGTWARRATARGFAFLGFVCIPTSTLVAPPGACEGRLSTNPITIGLPSFDALAYPLVLDMATSQVAFGKIREAAAEGKRVPEEWMISRDGSRDPQQVVDGEGALRPLGGSTSGYKGFGLAVMAELLASNFADAPVSGQEEGTHDNAATFVLVDPLEFTTKDRLERRITAFREYVRSAESAEDPSPGVAAMGDTCRLPGEPEHRAKVAQSEAGISIRTADASALRELADVIDVEAIPEPFVDVE